MTTRSDTGSKGDSRICNPVERHRIRLNDKNIFFGLKLLTEILT